MKIVPGAVFALIFGPIARGFGPEMGPQRARPSAGPFWSPLRGRAPSLYAPNIGPKIGPGTMYIFGSPSRGRVPSLCAPESVQKQAPQRCSLNRNLYCTTHNTCVRLASSNSPRAFVVSRARTGAASRRDDRSHEGQTGNWNLLNMVFLTTRSFPDLYMNDRLQKTEHPCCPFSPEFFGPVFSGLV